MVYNPNTLRLSVPTKILEYKCFIEQCCDFILDVDRLGDNFSKCAKFKLVIMELLTNAIKHSQTESFIEIIKEEGVLKVRKIDSGRKFNFKNAHTNEIHEMPLKVLAYESKILAILGNNYKLPLLIRNKNTVEFLEPEEVEYQSMATIPENFGLLIIKQCSDNFYYYYDDKDNLNVFEVIFKL